jgi:hypothetical protein
MRFPGAVTPEQPPQFGQVSDPRIEDSRAGRPPWPAEVEAWIFNANAINIAGFVLYGEFCAVLPRRYTTFSIAGV